MKRLTAVMLCIYLIFSLAACNNPNKQDGGDSAGQNAQMIKDGKPAAGEIGAYQVSIEGYAITKDYQGKDAIVLYYQYTNKSETPVSFLTAVSRAAYQNGEVLPTATLIDPGVPYDVQASMRQVEKDQSISVQTAFLLNDTKSEVKAELMGFGEAASQTVEKTFSLKK